MNIKSWRNCLPLNKPLDKGKLQVSHKVGSPVRTVKHFNTHFKDRLVWIFMIK